MTLSHLNCILLYVISRLKGCENIRLLQIVAYHINVFAAMCTWNHNGYTYAYRSSVLKGDIKRHIFECGNTERRINCSLNLTDVVDNNLSHCNDTFTRLSSILMSYIWYHLFSDNHSIAKGTGVVGFKLHYKPLQYNFWLLHPSLIQW